MHPSHRLVWYAFLNWFLLFMLWGLAHTIAGDSAVPIVLILSHLGIVPMLAHQYLLKAPGERMNNAWKAGLAFGLVGIGLDAVGYGWYLGGGAALAYEWTTYMYLVLRIILPPITAKWLEPHLEVPTANGNKGNS